MTMRIAAVVPTVNRHEALLRAVEGLRAQSIPLEQIVVSAPTWEGIPGGLRDAGDLELVIGSRGASRQRNVGVQAVREDVEVIIFLDDDSVPRQDLAENVAEVFRDPEVVAMTGRMACDGAAEGREIPAAELMTALEGSHALDQLVEQVPSETLYGCNMAIRRDAILSTPFDEALPLYSWLEDLDVARRLRARGRVVRDSRCVVAHQGSASGGRTQHVRFGYSCVANPLYLRKKGSLGWADVARLIAKPTLGNFRGLLGPDSVSRRLRLQGEGAALIDLLRGRLTPGRIQQL